MTNEEIEKDNKNTSLLTEELPLAIVTGILFGAGGVFTKTAVQGIEVFNILSIENWISLIVNPAFVGMVVTSVIGMITWFWALSKGRASVVTPVISGFMVLVPVIVGLTIFSEPPSLLKIIGISLVTIGSLILGSRRAS